MRKPAVLALLGQEDQQLLGREPVGAVPVAQGVADDHRDPTQQVVGGRASQRLLVPPEVVDAQQDGSLAMPIAEDPPAQPPEVLLQLQAVAQLGQRVPPDLLAQDLLLLPHELLATVEPPFEPDQPGKDRQQGIERRLVHRCGQVPVGACGKRGGHRGATGGRPCPPNCFGQVSPIHPSAASSWANSFEYPLIHESLWRP